MGKKTVAAIRTTNVYYEKPQNKKADHDSIFTRVYNWISSKLR